MTVSLAVMTKVKSETIHPKTIKFSSFLSDQSSASLPIKNEPTTAEAVDIIRKRVMSVSLNPITSEQ